MKKRLPNVRIKQEYLTEDRANRWMIDKGPNHIYKVRKMHSDQTQVFFGNNHDRVWYVPNNMLTFFRKPIAMLTGYEKPIKADKAKKTKAKETQNGEEVRSDGSGAGQAP